ncbi:uncharacterized protein PADG_02948 [Paracoccidioides brasiliensis Pb18]|uniref:Nuclear RNA binding protein n=1 Tax=Paracoccidioides brasiliensis (strain Pb18) TaxID=502780 RepID=C1G6Z3_PARBD|nr:uncharacterized protein PADG_02948 [Paracoccidioides brasiliensis Pb18]EEH46850.2 hypothetical protein PADG_02948 [Paracoccidioides brasiliensis Pb18]
MAKEKKRDRKCQKKTKTNHFAELTLGQQLKEQTQEQTTEIHHSKHKAAKECVNEQIDHQYYLAPCCHHVGHQRESDRTAVNPDTANGSAGLTLSGKRKLVSGTNNHSSGYHHDPLYDHGQVNHGQVTPKGPELQSSRETTATNGLEYIENQYEDGPNKSPKRMRSNEWPLSNRESSYSSNQAHGGKDSTTSRLRSRRRQSQGKTRYCSRSVSASAAPAGEGERRSRFLEGSMNDRVSEKPPGIYIGEDVDEAIDRYTSANQETSAWGNAGTPGRGWKYGRSYTSTTTTSVSSVASETPSTKSSGLARFGQAIASTFNTFGIWNNVAEIRNGSQDGTKPTTTAASTTSAATIPPRHVLKERKAQAEKAYAELKASGYVGTVKSTPTCGGNHGPEKNGVKKQKQAPDHTQQRMHVHSTNSIPNKEHNTSLSKSVFRPSLQDLRKAASFINVTSSTKRGNSIDDDVQGDSRVLRNQHSHRDLEKQRKLKKKVITLETQLERAKQQLSMISGPGDADGNVSVTASGFGGVRVSLNEPEDEEVQDLAPIPPSHIGCVRVGRKKKFVPGALASLPSERILLGQIAEKPIVNPVLKNKAISSSGALDREDTNNPHSILKKRGPAVNNKDSLTTLPGSRDVKNLALAPRTHQGHDSDSSPTHPDKYLGRFGDSLLPKRTQSTRKAKLQKPELFSYPSSKNNEKASASFPSQHTRDGQLHSGQNPNSDPKLKATVRRCPSTASSCHNIPHGHSDDPDPNMDTNTKPKPKRNCSSGTVIHGDDIPPVPPLPVKFAASVSGRGMKENNAPLPQEFDWPEDFL